MAQTLQVLKCFKCSVFQVQIKKKSKRWVCKLCEEKQSVIKIYGEGSGKDCRLHVQKLNEMRGMQEEAKKDELLNFEEDPEEPSWDDAYEEDDNPADTIPVMAKKSKWSDYLDHDSEDESPSMEGNRKYNIFPKSQIQEKNLESLNNPGRENSFEQPFFDTVQVNRQQKLRLENEYKHPTFEGINPTLNSDDSTKGAHKKEEMATSTQDFNDGKLENPKTLKSKSLFCATKNEELDELLEL